MANNRICNLLNIKYPIFQGGMAWVADADLAAAVSEAGGLGIIGSGSMEKEHLEAAIDRLRQLTDRPFGVNVMLMNPAVDDLAELVIEKQIPVVTTGAGSPAKYMEAWLAAGIKVIPVVASATQAERMERIGATAVVAEGGEAGGHVGEVNSMVLTPSVVDRVKVPVLAAGGIADGRGLAAALMLGAEGVQVGTRFICATESPAHANYKAAVVKAKEVDSVVTGRAGGHPVRSLKSPLQRKLLAMEKEGASTAAADALAVGSLRIAMQTGDKSTGSFMAGQAAGLVRKEAPCAEIIQAMVKEARELLAGSIKEDLL